VIRSAIGSLRIKGPVTYTLVLIKIKSRRASIFLGYTIDASVKDIADSWFGMCIKSVQTGTKIVCSLWFLKLETILTVDVEVMIARLPFPA
jgi:hypothetical protein